LPFFGYKASALIVAAQLCANHPEEEAICIVLQILYCERLIIKARKKRTRAPRSTAASISMGPLVVSDTPKKMMMHTSSMPKMMHVTKSGNGCCEYLFMDLFFRLVRGLYFVFCSIHHIAEDVNTL
jgi:hypothetical protein